jgi:hypothetical protein
MRARAAPSASTRPQMPRPTALTVLPATMRPSPPAAVAVYVMDPPESTKTSLAKATAKAALRFFAMVAGDRHVAKHPQATALTASLASTQTSWRNCVWTAPPATSRQPLTTPPVFHVRTAQQDRERNVGSPSRATAPIASLASMRMRRPPHALSAHEASTRQPLTQRPANRVKRANIRQRRASSTAPSAWRDPSPTRALRRAQ